MPGNFFQNIDNAVKKGKTALKNSGVIINDDRGNALNVPLNEEAPTGIYRTYVASGNSKSVMVGLSDWSIKGDSVSNGKKYSQGFTPEEAYFIKDSNNIDDKTGLPIGYGVVKTNVSLKNNTSVGKITRTDVNFVEVPLMYGSFDFGLIVPGGGYSLISNVPNNNTSNKSNKGWTDPYFYVQHKDRINSKTGLPLELGDTPYGIDPYFAPGATSSNLTNPSTPFNVVYGGNGRVGMDKIHNLFGNNEQFLFSHNLDISESTGANRIPPPDSFIGDYTDKFRNIHLGSKFFLSTSVDNEDPVMFGYDIEIIYDSSPLFNGAILNFIHNHQSNSEISAREEVWSTFCSQFLKFFKIDQVGRIDTRYRNTGVSKQPTAEQINESIDLKKQKGDFDTDPDRIANSKIENTAENAKKVEAENRKGNPTGNLAAVKNLDPKIVSYTKKPVNLRGENEGKYFKTYYLKKIAGLKELVEKNVSVNSDTVKSMIDYGKDLITLTLYDDVSMNTGYMAYLYKSLSWSRLNGKQIIPENLLRFDAKITITEIRQFNRVVKSYNNDTGLDVFPDLISKYEYTLYDCQFMFNEFPHKDDIDMSSAKPELADFDVAFNYKYSTMAVEKFSFNSGASSSLTANSHRLDNSLEMISAVKSKDSDKMNIESGQIVTTKSAKSLTPYDSYPRSASTSGKKGLIEDEKERYLKSLRSHYRKNWDKHIQSNFSDVNTLEKAKKDDMFKKMFNQLGDKLKKAATREINRQIIKQARLLNKTLDNIRNSIGLGRMSYPKNVYDGINPNGKNSWYKGTQLSNDVRNSFRDFVGQSVRGFFSGE